MPRRLVSSALLPLAFSAAFPSLAGAQQSLGTFRWQLAPLCNVITVDVSQLGSALTLDGFDDQCGAATRGSVVGTAFPNPDGTIGVGLSIVATPGAAPVHVDVALNLATIGGPWRDSAGNIGTFVFNPASPAPGTPRPPTGGLISTVSPGPGLNGGGVTGPVSLSVDFAGPGTATTVARSDHTHAKAGSANVAVGPFTLGSLTTGGANTGFGSRALLALTTGQQNTAVGTNALQDATTASGNVAVGAGAMVETTGGANVAVGTGAMAEATTGQSNTIVGYGALAATQGSDNTALGSLALVDIVTGSSNVAIGSAASFQLTSGSNNIYIGNWGPAGSESGHIRIGTVGAQTSTYVAGIHGAAVSTLTDQPVLVDSSGNLGTSISSARFKRDITPLEDARHTVLRLQPVSFRYTPEQMRGDAVQYGLIAEQVAEVMPELVIRGEDGQPLTVKYHVLPALLLAEIQRLERERAAQAQLLETQAKAIEALRVELEALRNERR